MAAAGAVDANDSGPSRGPDFELCPINPRAAIDLQLAVTVHPSHEGECTGQIGPGPARRF